MKHDLTTGTWQDDTGCPISIILVSISDGARGQRWHLSRHSDHSRSVHILLPSPLQVQKIKIMRNCDYIHFPTQPNAHNRQHLRLHYRYYPPLPLKLMQQNPAVSCVQMSFTSYSIHHPVQLLCCNSIASNALYFAQYPVVVPFSPPPPSQVNQLLHRSIYSTVLNHCVCACAAGHSFVVMVPSSYPRPSMLHHPNICLTVLHPGICDHASVTAVHSSSPWVRSIYSTVLNLHSSSAWDAVHSWLEGTESIVYHTIGMVGGHGAILCQLIVCIMQ